MHRYSLLQFIFQIKLYSILYVLLNCNRLNIFYSANLKFAILLKFRCKLDWKRVVRFCRLNLTFSRKLTDVIRQLAILKLWCASNMVHQCNFQHNPVCADHRNTCNSELLDSNYSCKSLQIRKHSTTANSWHNMAKPEWIVTVVYCFIKLYLNNFPLKTDLSCYCLSPDISLILRKIRTFHRGKFIALISWNAISTMVAFKRSCIWLFYKH